MATLTLWKDFLAKIYHINSHIYLTYNRGVDPRHRYIRFYKPLLTSQSSSSKDYHEKSRQRYLCLISVCSVNNFINSFKSKRPLTVADGTFPGWQTATVSWKRYFFVFSAWVLFCNVSVDDHVWQPLDWRPLQSESPICYALLQDLSVRSFVLVYKWYSKRHCQVRTVNIFLNVSQPNKLLIYWWKWQTTSLKTKVMWRQRLVLVTLTR